LPEPVDLNRSGKAAQLSLQALDELKLRSAHGCFGLQVFEHSVRDDHVVAVREALNAGGGVDCAVGACATLSDELAAAAPFAFACPPPRSWPTSASSR